MKITRKQLKRIIKEELLKMSQDSRWGKPRKNVKRRDPRYFLDEASGQQLHPQDAAAALLADFQTGTNQTLHVNAQQFIELLAQSPNALPYLERYGYTVEDLSKLARPIKTQFARWQQEANAARAVGSDPIVRHRHPDTGDVLGFDVKETGEVLLDFGRRVK